MFFSKGEKTSARFNISENMQQNLYDYFRQLLSQIAFYRISIQEN